MKTRTCLRQKHYGKAGEAEAEAEADWEELMVESWGTDSSTIVKRSLLQHTGMSSI